jgi:hypothetical protein
MIEQHEANPIRTKPPSKQSLPRHVAKATQKQKKKKKKFCNSSMHHQILRQQQEAATDELSQRLQLISNPLTLSAFSDPIFKHPRLCSAKK